MSGSHKAVAERHGSGQATGGRRRRKRSRGRVVAVVLVSLLVLIVAAVGGIYLWLNADIKTFSGDGISRDRPAAGAGGQNVLVIGSDSRSGDNSSYGGGEGDVGRSDTAFLLHVYADRKHAVAVSIPRDTLVDIPPCRLPDGKWTEEQKDTMFNAAFSVGETAEGNPACTQNTVEKLTGLRVDHTVVVDFEGFSKMTSAVGGVTVCLPKDIYQRDLSPNRGSRGKLLFDKGEQTVSGQKALDYVRIRHGIGDGSDIGRIKRQQAFVASLIKKVKSQGMDPTTLLPLAKAATKSMTVDPGLGSVDKLVSFAMSMKDVDLHNTKFITVPWRYQGARVAIVRPQADALWADLKADRTIDGKDASGGSKSRKSPTQSPAESSGSVSGAGISVAVYNGTGVTGLAARAAETLRADGFTVTGTATAASQDHTTTLVTHGPGEQEQAKTVARVFPGARLQPADAPGISVTLGQEYAADPSPSASAPTTLPSEVADTARSADTDPCSDLSYG
ncbi:LCP family protein [Streptomyces lonegramiae]|uniref:LCP family protein n=1 Tax=Streptomyces lonegramiae TaxID=3075524 RepID=A0ABU2XA55_9ACTN|nr:LCP family protein [Streptomyces sp. DSM 41529]MDT0542005.1 LCP family protein [Streptomyces sp. DSM 41529]